MNITTRTTVMMPVKRSKNQARVWKLLFVNRYSHLLGFIPLSTCIFICLINLHVDKKSLNISCSQRDCCHFLWKTVGGSKKSVGYSKCPKWQLCLHTRSYYKTKKILWCCICRNKL